MAKTKMKSLTMTSKGQVTISADARKKLGLDKGDSLIEIVIGNCLILMPAEQILADTTKRAKKALDSIGLTADDMKEEIKSQRKSRLKKRYPNL